MDIGKDNFERLVRSHKDTIYTVCYMFSKDEDEVADLIVVAPQARQNIEADRGGKPLTVAP